MLWLDKKNEILFINDGSESARFDENGNLGIGITSPTVRLEVSKGAIHKQLRVHRDVNGDNTTMGSILFAGDDSSVVIKLI